MFSSFFYIINTESTELYEIPSFVFLFYQISFGLKAVSVDQDILHEGVKVFDSLIGIEKHNEVEELNFD